MSVNRLNLLDLCPGGHVGRFVIWTEGAFKQLKDIFGSYTNAGDSKIKKKRRITISITKTIVDQHRF